MNRDEEKAMIAEFAEKRGITKCVSAFVAPTVQGALESSEVSILRRMSFERTPKIRSNWFTHKKKTFRNRSPRPTVSFPR